MGKLGADEQKPHRRPTRDDELAQHSEVTWFARGGKCGGCPAKRRVLTWGDPSRETWEGVSRGHMTGTMNRGVAKGPFKHRNPQA